MSIHTLALVLAAALLVSACSLEDSGEADAGPASDASGDARTEGDSTAEPQPDAAPSGPPSGPPQLEDVTLRGLTEAEVCGRYQAEFDAPPPEPFATGSDVASCTPGAMTADGLAATRSRVNWYRRLYGLPDVGEPEPAENAADQSCALMMSANAALSHQPPPDWTCYDAQGADASARGNLYISAQSPTSAIDLLIFEFGSEDTLGHRRWTLSPGQRGRGYGFVPPAGGNRSGFCQSAFSPLDSDVPRDEPVPYPPAGAFPAAMLSYEFQGVRVAAWSMGWASADFSAARLDLTEAASGTPVPLAEDGALRALPDGFGAPTALWRPARAPAIGDVWRVRIEGVRVRGVRADPVIYEVELVDCGARPPF